MARPGPYFTEGKFWSSIDENIRDRKVMAIGDIVDDRSFLKNMWIMPMCEDKKVSIVIPTYNQVQFLPKALNSILGQSYKNIEVIVVNDASTDGTAEYLKTVTDERVKIVSLDKNVMTGEALNMGFMVATGELESYFSSDNIAYPSMIETLVRSISYRPDVDFIYGNFDWYDLDRKIKKHCKELIDMQFSNERLFDNCILGICWVWKKHLRLKTGRYQKEACEDYDMALRMMLNDGRFLYIDTPSLALYVHHKDNQTTAIAQQEIPMDVRIKNRILKAQVKKDFKVNRISSSNRLSELFV